jgi:DEAD/DEAH box helicase domain-containing protein
MLAAAMSGEDPIALVQKSGREQLPVDPVMKVTAMGDDVTHFPIPGFEERPSIDEVVEEIQSQPWYKNQIIDRRTIEARVAKTGANIIFTPPGVYSNATIYS